MATKTWHGSDGQWRDGNHWSPAGVPQNGDDVVIREGKVFALTGTALEQADSSFDATGGRLSAFANFGSFTDFGGKAGFAVRKRRVRRASRERRPGRLSEP